MITFTNTVIEILSNPSLEAFYVVEIGNNLYRITSYQRDITLSNGKTYISDGRLLGVDPPQLSSTVDREVYKILLSDPEFISGLDIESSFVGQFAEVRLCFVNPITGQPEVDIENTALIYRGTVDSAAYSIDTSIIGDVTLSISCSSPMYDLDLIKPVYLSKDYIRGLDSADNSCDQVYQGSGQLSLKWGKE
jgi:hypothetical protein